MELVKQFEERASMLFHQRFISLSKKEQYLVVASIVNELAYQRVEQTDQYVVDHKERQLYYFSMEFLMGRLLTNNLMNLGMYQTFSDALKEYGIDLNTIEDEESDAGLGNGGLGRLAACFLDSLASTKYRGNGITLRYRNGFFKQKFVNNEQIELPDLWLQDGNMWEQRMVEDACIVSFYGRVEAYLKEGKTYFRTVDDIKVKAMPYDLPVVGANTEICNTLRMYDVMPVEDAVSQKEFVAYEKELMDITSCLYPDDSTVKGVELRIKQQYLFVSAGLNNIIKKHLATHQTMDDFAKYNVIQINDTHPALLIPELMRVLIDDHNYSWDAAWAITSASIAYTNHTILAEALEKWDQGMMQTLMPRVYMIIEEINRQFINQLRTKQYDNELIYKLSIIHGGKVHMANLSIVGSFSVNGVAALHTQILIESEMADWNQLYPGKFNNKTNGITQRRWLQNCNPELTALLEATIGNDFKTKPVEGFLKLMDHVEDKELINQFDLIKQQKKQQLATYIKEHEGIHVNVNSIFDIQVKRLHAYKRQLLNVLHIIYLYQRLKSDPSFKASFYPQTFFFGAKAAPSYVFAKNVIRLINTLSHIINNDPEVKDHLNLIMVENYNVSYAEMLMPAADVSEQISTAGYEASGTGNMKFMMNGALTIGTMDGANVEIYDLVKDDNIFIFGLSKNEVFEMQKGGSYNAQTRVSENPDLALVFDFLQNIHLYDPSVTYLDFRPIFNDLFDHNDHYLIIQDFKAYQEAQAKLNALYKNRGLWNQKCLVNIAKSGFFSSDRTIYDYATEIWNLKPMKL